MAEGDIILRVRSDGLDVPQRLAQNFAALTGDVGQVVEKLRQASAAAGQSETKFLELAGALSRQALAAGDAARAEQIMAQAMGQQAATAGQTEQASLRSARAEAQLAAALGNRPQAIAQISAALQAQSERTLQVIAAERQLVTLQNQAVAAEQKEADAALRTAQAMARAEAAEGNRAGALARLQSAQNLASATGASDNAIAGSRAQIARLQQAQEGATASSGRFAASLGGISRVAGALGLVFGVQQMVAFGKGAGEAALALDHTIRTTREIAGSTAVYNQIVAEARNQQKLFGGSLQANIEGLSGLAVTSRQTGASLNQLVDLQKRLTILNPAQGAQGGLIALNEALAGNITSLSRRFNIPRDELRAFTDETKSAGDRLKALDEFLNKVGITSAAVSRSVGDTAQTYNQLSAEAENAKVATGNLLANLFKFPAKVATSILITTTRQLDATEQVRKESQAVFDAAATYDVYNAAVERKNRAANADILQGREAVGVLEPLSRSQFDYAQALIRTGVASEDAVSKSRQFADVISAGAAASAKLGVSSKDLIDRMIALSESGDQNKATVDSLARAYEDASLRPQALAAALTSMENAQRAAAQAAADEEREQRRLSASVSSSSDAYVSSADAALRDARAKELLSAQTDLLQARTQAAADAFLAANPAIDESGIRAAITTKAIPPLVGQLALLTFQIRDAKSALDAITPAAIAQGFADQRAGERTGGKVKSQAELDAIGEQNQAQSRLNKVIEDGQNRRRQQSRADLEAERAIAAAKGDTGRQIALLRQEQALFTRGSNEYKQIEAQIIELQTKRARGAAQAANRSLTALDRDAINLAGDYQGQLEEVNRQLERGNLTQHQRNQLLIKQRDLQEKIADEQERSTRAAIDAQRAILDDAKQRILEAREQRIAQNAARTARDPNIRALAEIKAQDIPLEQAQRALDIQKKLREAGQAVPAVAEQAQKARTQPIPGLRLPAGAEAPVAGLPPVAPTAPTGGVTVNLSISFGPDGRPSVRRDPGVNLNLLLNGALSSAAAGG